MISKSTDFLVVTLLLIAGAAVWLLFRLPPLFGGAVYMLPASAYLLYRGPRGIYPIIWASTVFGFIFGFGFDFFENINKAWEVQNLILPSFFAVQPIDNILGYGMMTLLMVLFYRHFFETTPKRVSHRIYPTAVISLLVCVVLVTVYLMYPSALDVPYPYVVGGLLPVLAVILYGFRHPMAIPEIACVSGYFFFVWLIAEYVAVATEGWIYPGQYIGFIKLGAVTFPVEELLFWMVWYGATTVVFYKAFIDHE